jgi:hypothetical protein
VSNQVLPLLFANVLMLLVHSAGILTALTGTGVSHVTRVFVDYENECKENGNNSCNEETQRIEQKTKCKIVNEIENDGGSNGNSNSGNGNGDITCWNFAQNPENGDAIVDDEPLDIFAPIT